MKKWLIRRNKVNIQTMANYMAINPIVANIIANRGIMSYRQAEIFINPDLKKLNAPNEIDGMNLAIELTAKVIKNNKKIVVYGDYDVDGVSSTVIIYKAIKALGGIVSYHVPDRVKDGYGLNMSAVEDLIDMKTQLLITCDNGIASVNEIKKIKENNIDVIVIDHHEPPYYEENNNKFDILPMADVIVDPKQQKCNYQFKQLCAGGLAYKFAAGLFKHFNLEFDKNHELLVFAAIATICDIVDLVDENRIIAKNGLDFMANTPNKGLKKLIEKTGLIDKIINEYHVGFVIGPNINATGRLENAKIAIELFTSEDDAKIENLANQLISLNESRKQMTEDAAQDAIAQVENSSLKNQNVLVIYNEKIHESIAGIVAGRVKEKYYKPVIMLTKGDNAVKGSARSIEGYNIFDELLKCKHLFLKFGGHAMAAGLSMLEKNIDELRILLNKNENLSEDQLTEIIRIDDVIDFNEISLRLINEINDLAPFGKANPTPIFGSKNVLCNKIYILGKNQNVLKLNLRSYKTNIGINAISFDLYDDFKNAIINKFGDEKYNRLIDGTEQIMIDIVYTLNINEYNGKQYSQIILKDFRLAE